MTGQLFRCRVCCPLERSVCASAVTTHEKMEIDLAANGVVLGCMCFLIKKNCHPVKRLILSNYSSKLVSLIRVLPLNGMPAVRLTCSLLVVAVIIWVFFLLECQACLEFANSALYSFFSPFG